MLHFVRINGYTFINLIYAMISQFAQAEIIPEPLCFNRREATGHFSGNLFRNELESQA